MRVRVALAALWLAACASGEPVTLPSFTLSDQSGRPVRADDLKGKPAVVSFIFTTCVEACPIITAQLARAQAQARAAGLADRVHFVSITVDPATDTPARLKTYAERFGADLSTWSFLTGSPEEISRIMGAVGVTSAASTRGLAHDAPILFVDGAGRVVERQRDAVPDPAVVVATLRKLAS